MKKFAIYFLLLIPQLTFGQLFPKIGEFKGNIEKVVEKTYGKENHNLDPTKSTLRPSAFSGWKYIYLFDENSNIKKRTSIFKGNIQDENIYQRDTIENRRIERVINNDKNNALFGNYIEYEKFMDSLGRIEKVNFWEFNAKACERNIFLTEENPEYKDNRLVSFTRHLIREDGTPDLGEKCNLIYNSEGKLDRLVRLDLSSGFSTVIQYKYDSQGFLSIYAIDLLSELQEYKKVQIQNIDYKYDKQGNWIRKYYQSDKRKYTEAKRRIKYWKSK